MCYLWTQGSYNLRPSSTKKHFPKTKTKQFNNCSSCADCNNNASDLIETFRLYLALHVDDLEDKINAAYFYEALRTYKHNKKLQREILGIAELVELKTPSGKSIGGGMKVVWNSKSHDAVIERIVRGLYFHHFGEVLPSIANVSPKWFNQPDEEFLKKLADLKKNVIRDNQFVYLYGRQNEDPSVSVWYFEFCGRHWAGAHTSMNTLPVNLVKQADEIGG